MEPPLDQIFQTKICGESSRPDRVTANAIAANYSDEWKEDRRAVRNGTTPWRGMAWGTIERVRCLLGLLQIPRWVRSVETKVKSLFCLIGWENDDCALGLGIEGGEVTGGARMRAKL